jgi:hypothetical protein
MRHLARTFTYFFLLGVSCATATPVFAQATVEGIRVKVDAAELEIAGRVQTQFNTTSVAEEPTTEWLLRRVRLTAKVKVNDIVSGKVQPDFAGNRVSLKDAYLKLRFAPGFQLLAGKAYRPFSLLEQTSSTRILPIERGADIRGIGALDEYSLIHELEYSDREIGLQVMGAPEGAPLGFAYAAGVFDGPLSGAEGLIGEVEELDEDSHQFAARATIRPFERVQLGAGWSSREFASPGLDASVFELERGNAFEVDLEYGTFSPGVHLLGEVAWGDANPFAGDEFLGAQAWLGYRTGPLGEVISTLEPILRVSYGGIDREISVVEELGGTLFTPGLNVYFGGLNRMMFNYDVWLPDGEGDSEQSFKAMFQLVF